MVLVEDLQYCTLVVEVIVLNFFDFEIVVDVVIYVHLFFAGDIKFFHDACPRHFHIVFYFLIDLANNVLKYVLVRHPEIKKKQHGHKKVTRNKAYEVVCNIACAAVFITSLKFDDLKNVNNQKYQWDEAIVDHELCERTAKCANK